MRLLAVTLPPAIADDSEDGYRRQRQIDDACIEGFCRTLSHLLRSFGTDGTLSVPVCCNKRERCYE